MLHNPTLDGSPFYWKGGTVGIELIHGFSATTAEVRPLATALHETGYTIAGPLLPGHYSEPQELNRVRWQDWVDAVEKAYQELAGQCKTVIVGGESTGALLSMYLAIQHPEIAAILLYAPALKLNLSPINALLIHLLAPFIPWLPKENMDSNELWQGYPVNPLKGAIQLLKLQKEVYPLLSRIKQPVLIVQGKLDTTVHAETPEIIYDQVGSAIKEKFWLEQSAHCVILDREFPQVVALTQQFLNRILDKN